MPYWEITASGYRITELALEATHLKPASVAVDVNGHMQKKAFC